MPTTRYAVFCLLVVNLMSPSLTGCVQIVDDDDGGGDDGSTSAASGNGEGADATGNGPTSTTSGGQNRNVRVCESRLVCEDGTVFESGQTLCLTAAEVALELEFVAEACLEDMTPGCERIGDGTSLECGAECSEPMEPCECGDPSQGCEV